MFHKRHHATHQLNLSVGQINEKEVSRPIDQHKQHCIEIHINAMHRNELIDLKPEAHSLIATVKSG